VQHGSALRSGETSSNVDDLSAQGRTASTAKLRISEPTGSPEQVMGDRREQHPGRIRTETPGRHMRQRAVDQIGEHGFDDRMAPVSQISRDDRFGRVGEERVIPPDREQFVLRAASRTRRTINRAVTASGPEANAVYEVSATSASEIHALVSGSCTAPGYFTAAHA
jgi:hypothetical protein